LEGRPDLFQYISFEVVERVLAKVENDTDLIVQADSEDPRISEAERRKELKSIEAAIDEKRQSLRN
jgi:hypothetical protein